MVAATVSRDMSERQFRDALKARGWKVRPIMGYVDCGGVDISMWNAGAGASRRQQLAYLIAAKKGHDARKAVH